MRIIAMLMILILHLQGHGGLLSAVKIDKENLFTSHYAVVWLIEVICFCAVNCYALISGYVGWRSQITLTKLGLFWIQVIFYGLGVLIVLSLFFDIHPSLWGKYANAVMSGQYWFATAYFALMLFMPVLNLFIQQSDKTKGLLTVSLLLGFFSLFASFNKEDVFHLHAGYSAIWLAVLYLTGGMIARFNWGSILSKKASLLLFLLSVMIVWVNKLTSFSSIDWLKYPSPLIVICAIALLLLFSQLEIVNLYLIKSVMFLSSGSFAVYLIHDNREFRKHIMSGFTASWAEYPIWVMILKIVIAACLIYLFCVVIDYFRRALFRLIRLNKTLEKIEKQFLK